MPRHALRRRVNRVAGDGLQGQADDTLGSDDGRLYHRTIPEGRQDGNKDVVQEVSTRGHAAVLEEDLPRLDSYLLDPDVQMFCNQKGYKSGANQARLRAF